MSEQIQSLTIMESNIQGNSWYLQNRRKTLLLRKGLLTTLDRNHEQKLANELMSRIPKQELLNSSELIEMLVYI